MIELPNESDVATLRDFLKEADYNSESLTRLLGSALPPDRGAQQAGMFRTGEATPLNALIRLFLLGVSIDNKLGDEVLPASFLDVCSRIGLLERTDDRLRARIVIVPIEDLLFASDAFDLLGSEDAAEFVLPASTHSANFLRLLTLRSRVGSMLDLGCGCGIHALFAARHCDNVVATDISPEAIRYTQFNASLNSIDNIECLSGDLFEPVADRSFDLIISNPPFVIGPDQEFTYRDNRMELDEFCELVVGESARHLADGGHLQMLFESVEIEGEPWNKRIQAWVSELACDTWLLHSPPISTRAYAMQRLSDISGELPSSEAKQTGWVEYLESRHVTAIHPGMIVLRKSGGRNWFHVHNVTADITQPAGEAVRRGLVACDLLGRGSNDEALLDITLGIASELALEQQFSRTDGSWNAHTSTLRMSNGIPMDAEVDTPILAFMNILDGTKSLRDCIDEFSKLAGADVSKVTADLLPIIRLFIGRGFIEES